MRHPVADEIAAASGNDGEPARSVLLEHRALERIELVADENGNHGEAPGFLSRQCLPSLRGAKRRSNPAFRLRRYGLLRRFAPRNDEFEHLT
jgi:hypothetical protein